ncbi:Facilitated trehalose transporter Tret1 [Seminavis robusta]|uniref:Hexose transporter 1 n=1 Tax=Seminavis robusta TaxID=568900 RepID=A0A9N8H1E7_9STRA|nr:Facilitated trehalose transporter Tret1 [Seminavis robusta]|eukprot:Sro3_g002170.1 Facilitated trehalose transporter Tret1 (551) ;mRNA; f:76516-78168
MSTTADSSSNLLRKSRQERMLEDSINNPIPPAIEAEIEKTQDANSEDLEADGGNEKEEQHPENGKLSSLKASHSMPKRTKKFIILVACVAAMGGLIFGYDIAGAGATFVMEGFELHFGWKCVEGDLECTPATTSEIDRDKGLINGLFGIGATFGALINPYFAEKHGRRISLSISAVVFILGAAIQSFSPTMAVMWTGRIFSGMGIGMLSMCAPIYIAECSPEHIRGALGTLWQLAITLGIVVASAANLGLQHLDWGWRLSYGGNISFAIVMLICLAFMPESPRWLAAHASEEETRKALARMRFEDEIDLEYTKIMIEIGEELEMGVAPWSEVFSDHNCMRRRVLLGVLFFAFQQLAGINAVMFYAPDILNKFFSENTAVYGTFILNVVNCLATFITVATVDKFGRTKLLVVGGCLMFPFLLVIGILATVDQTQGVGYAVIVFSALYIISFAASWGPVLWVIVGEMFPFRTRGKAVGAATMSHWIFTTIVGALFPVASSASLSACFFFFAAMIFIGNCVVYFYQVETAERTIEQIDEAYATHKPALKRKDW